MVVEKQAVTIVIRLWNTLSGKRVLRLLLSTQDWEHSLDSIMSTGEQTESHAGRVTIMGIGSQISKQISTKTALRMSTFLQIDRLHLV